MSYRITQEAIDLGKPVPSIAIFEMGQQCGGRLQSQFGSGMFNMAARPDSKDLQYPIQEYGGMRMNPFTHKRLFKTVRAWAKNVFGNIECKPVEECTYQDENCCKDILTRMHVGNIRYASTNPKVGANLEKSTIADIGPDSPFGKCIMMSKLITNKYGEDLKGAPEMYTEAANAMCDSCDQQAKEEDKKTCVEVCTFFPPENRTPAAVSCSGYDLGENPTTKGLVGLTAEVTSDITSKLYLFNMGFQNFAESLGFMHGKNAVAPHYNMQLTGVETNCGKTEELVNLQAKSVSESEASSKCTKTNDAPVTLSFANGTKYTAKMAYLTPLPFDLPQLDGFDAWEEQFLKYSNPNGAVKIVLGWTDENAALPARANLKPCVSEGSQCDRLILDGKMGEQLLRQVWLWDKNSIMIYLTAPADEPDFAANLVAQKAWKEGMNKTVDAIMDQLRVGTGVSDLAYPDFARFKRWVPGSLLIDWNADEETGNTVSDRVGRPLGTAAPVYYGNSEMAKEGIMHGWVEGALEMADTALEDILPKLGLDKKQEVHV
jgi:hypothetical protein